MNATKDLRLIFWICILISVAGLMPLLGLPGAGLMIALEAPLQWLGLYPGTDALGPGAWGLAILLTLLWPISIYVGYWYAFYRFKTLPRFAKYLMWLLIPLLWAVLLMWVSTINHETSRVYQNELVEESLQELGVIRADAE